jgi:hypothetical protein
MRHSRQRSCGTCMNVWIQSRHRFQARKRSGAQRYSLVALCPVVSRAGLSEDEVVGAEDLTVGASANGIHGPGLKIHEHSAGNIATASCLIEVNVDALKLKVRVSVVGTSGVNACDQWSRSRLVLRLATGSEECKGPRGRLVWVVGSWGLRKTEMKEFHEHPRARQDAGPQA